MTQGFETRRVHQLPQATLVNGGDLLTIEKDGGPLMAVPLGLIFPIRLEFFFTLAPSKSEVLWISPATESFIIPANFAGAVTSLDHAPAAAFTIAVKRNATQIGTIAIAANGTITLATTDGVEQAVAAGQILRAVAPVGTDPSIAGFGFACRARLS